MQRRTAITALGLLPATAWLPARAHHGWSSFDQDRPIYLEGRVTKSTWANPHCELMLSVPTDLKLPADLASRPIPPQTAPVDGKAMLAKTQLPRRKDRQWEIELAPLTRMEAWKVTPIKVGDNLAVVGFTLKEEKGDAVLRVEYLFVSGNTYALRSSPA
jgi:hypothetical protein